jgi:hypothetical protein
MGVIITQPRGAGSGGGIPSAPASLEFQENTGVLANSLTTIFNFTNTTGNTLFLNQINGESNARSEWFIYINDVLSLKTRSSVSDMNIALELYDYEFANTDNLKIKVIHYELGQLIDYSSVLNYHD